jgi:hypothetical protein
MVPSARKAASRMALLNASAGAARAPALFPVYRWGLIYGLDFSTRRVGVGRDKVMAGGTPANPATLASHDACENPRGGEHD